MWMPKDRQDWTLVVSGAALVVSFFGTIGNLRYTRRKFRQASEPELHCQMSITGSKYGSLSAAIQNLDSSVTIADVAVGLDLRVHPGRVSIRGGKWVPCCLKSVDPIAPLMSRELVYAEETSLNCLVHEKFPGFLQEVCVDGAKRWRDEMGFYHLELRHEKWDVRIRIAYRGAVHGGRKITRTVTATVEPQLKEYTLNVTHDGEITPKTGAFVCGWKFIGGD